MNKKLLICGAIATGLLLTACVKKEAPKEEEQEQVEVAASEPTASVPTQLEPVEEQPVVEEPTQQQVEVIREETPNTTTEIRREPTHLQKLLLQKQKRLKRQKNLHKLLNLNKTQVLHSLKMTPCCCHCCCNTSFRELRSKFYQTNDQKNPAKVGFFIVSM
jgi:hypothetical protein